MTLLVIVKLIVNYSLPPSNVFVRLVGHTGPVHCVCYSAKGDVLASSSSDRTVRIWIPNIDGGSIVLKGHTGILSPSYCFLHKLLFILLHS